MASALKTGNGTKTISRSVEKGTQAGNGKQAANLPVKIRQTKMLIDGKWVDAQSGKTLETLNPSAGEVSASVAEGDKADVGKAAKAACKALEEGPCKKMNAR